MEGIITLFRNLATSPEQLTSTTDFLAAAGLLLMLAVSLSIPLAIVSKMLLERERLGTSTRLRLAFGWTAITFGVAALTDALVLWLLGRVPHWTAVAPHCTLAVLAAVCALVERGAVNGELRQVRRHVDNAKRQPA
jgi:uncharacterized membrane protein YbhN (UPF0104 family)